MFIFYMFIYYMIMMLLMFFFLFMYFLLNKIVYFYEFELMNFSSIKFELIILFDWISLLFISIVLMISVMVIIYSMEYMSSDLNIYRFMYLVILFVLSMMLMILSPNMISILIGWDGLGLVSYCLVIYYQNESSFNSGMVTVLTNRLGDIMILMLIGMMMYLGSWNFMFFKKLNNLMMLFLLIASITKSAQIPFSSWLPMAMAAPTPVSSLVHSSTLVTAGVYLLIRFNYLMMESKKLMMMMMLLSLLTMFLAGLGANFEFDLKKIIALSTLSQLGIMIFCLSLGLPEVSLFHLLTHAMFKSMLFMCAGVIIHNMMGNQDIRFISMVTFNLPLISMFFNCATLSLCGIPFLSGFFSKDLILEMFLMGNLNKFIMVLLFISMGLTVMYSMRLLYYSFIKNPQLLIFMNYKSLKNKMGCSMIILFIMSIIMGLNLSWMLFSMKNMIYLTIKLKLMIYFYMIMGMMLGIFVSQLFLSKLLLSYFNMYIKFFMMMWFMPMIYGLNINKIMIFSNSLVYLVDLGWNEMLMGMNLMLFMKKIFNYDKYLKNFFMLMIFISYILLILLVC